MKVAPPSINWRKECTEKIGQIQVTMTAALSFLWFGMDIPRIVTMLPAGFQTLIPAAQWIATAIKPYEIMAGVAKQICTVLDVPDRWLAVRPSQLKKEQNRWTRWGIVANTIQTSIDSLFLIPNSWKWISLARWTRTIGTTPFVIERIKEGVTILTAFCRVRAAPIDIRRANGQIRRIQKKCLEGPLMELKKELTVGKNLERINRLKAAYQPKNKAIQLYHLRNEISKLENERTSKQKQLATAKPIISAVLTQQIEDLSKTIKAKKEKIARIEVWANNQNFDQLLEVVDYKIKKAEVQIANIEGEKKKIVAGSRYEASKMTVLTISNILLIAFAAILIPTAGLSILTLGGLLFFGRWVTSLTTGIFCVGKILNFTRYKEPLKLPQTYLVKA